MQNPHRPTLYVKSLIPPHLHHLREQLPPETLQMFEINRVIQDLSEVIEYNNQLEQSFRTQTANQKLEEMLNLDEKSTKGTILVDAGQLSPFLDSLNQTLEYWFKERAQVKQIWESVKNLGYYLEQDPINEKIKTSNDTIIRLQNRCQMLEKRIIVLSEEQNKNIKLQGEIKNLESQMREKDELITKLWTKLDHKDIEIMFKNSTITDKEREVDSIGLQAKALQETLSLFKISGKYNTQTTTDRFKHRFSTMISTPKTLNRIMEFLIPREMLEVSLTSKLINSQIRHYGGIFATVATNSMWDKENIQFTTLKGKKY